MKNQIICASIASTLVLISGLLTSCCCPGNCPTSQTQNPPLGLYVEDGVLMISGKPYRGMGVNYYNMFSRALDTNNDKSYVEGLEKLSKAKIPFVRFMCGNFWPASFKLYFDDKEAYFKLLDEVVETAEKNNVGLIPSLFWFYPCAPDCMGEPMDQLGNPKSKTIAFIKQYTEEVVKRYKDSPAIWGWEVGNEYNLHVDLPNASEHRPWAYPELGTPTNRTERDEFTSEQMYVVFDEIAKVVRKYDKTRILVTGNAVPHLFAYHNRTENSWDLDTREQFNEVLRKDNPAPFDTISVHVYPVKDKKYVGEAKNVEEVIKVSQDLALSEKKPLFIGEFGVPNSYSNEVKSVFTRMIKAIEKNNVPLSALWVYDFPHQDKEWNTTFENKRAFMLDMVSKSHAKINNSCLKK